MPRNRYYSGPVRPHFDGERFFTPGHATDRSLKEVLRWHRNGQRAIWPKEVPVTPARPVLRSDTPRITMVGHASILIQVAGVNILTDPVWSKRASPLSFLGPKRVTAPGIAFADLPPIDVVLISHNHYDHLDTATLKRLHREHRPRMIMPLGTDVTVARAVPGAQIDCGDWHERFMISDTVSVRLTPSYHWSARGLGDRRMALWSGFWIETNDARIWFSGDTGYGDGSIFHELRAAYGAPDIALLPIGAYEPRWFMAPQHVAPEEAVQIFKDIGATQALGFHWGTFQLTDEPREEPVELLRHSLKAEGIPEARFRALAPGEVYLTE